MAKRQTSTKEIIDRWARLLGKIDVQRVLGADMALGNELFTKLSDGAAFYDARKVLGSQEQRLQQNAISLELITDPVDRVNRLLGIVYGNQGQLQQNVISLELLTEIDKISGTALTGRDWSGDFQQLQRLAPIDKALIHNTAQPAADANILGADLSPTYTPTTFGIMICMSNAGIFRAVVINGLNSQPCDFNSGVALTANALYIFDLMVHSGDTVNFRYSVSGGNIKVLRVQEIDAGVR